MKHLCLLTLVVLFFSCGQTAKKAPVIDPETIKAAIVEVELMDSSSLYILLAEDGTINRKGSLNSRDKNLFMGISQEPYFGKLKKSITPDLLAYCKQTSVVANPIKQVNRITIAFSGPEVDAGFEYVTDEPLDKIPGPILDFINSAVQLTDPWYKNQQELSRPRRFNRKQADKQ